MLAHNLKAFLAVLFTALFVGAFAVQASENFDGARAPIFYSGTIVAIDPSYKILTVKAGPVEEAYITVSDSATVTKCNTEVSFNDLKIGDEVNITYFQDSLGGIRMATNIETSGMQC